MLFTPSLFMRKMNVFSESLFLFIIFFFVYVHEDLVKTSHNSIAQCIIYLPRYLSYQINKEKHRIDRK